jgi:hypothetical protein
MMDCSDSISSDEKVLNDYEEIVKAEVVPALYQLHDPEDLTRNRFK